MSGKYKPRPDPYELRLGLTLLERMLDKCTLEGACVVYGGDSDKDGYGSLWVKGQRKRAHRVMYEAFLGPISPATLEIDHLCQTPACVNPAHLEPVTGEENRRRTIARRTHCKHGHAYTEANVYWYGTRRKCRTCRANSDKARRLAR